ncbi:MAG: HD domain-containing protein [Acidobacteriaceae bacterium]|nr:HD domain-containing protein [Acidobacteriaceae bacterium]
MPIRDSENERRLEAVPRFALLRSESPNPPEYGERKSILVVDGSKPRRSVLCAALESLGHELVEARNVPEAIEHIADRRIDAVLLDFAGRASIEFCRIVKNGSTTKTISVLFLARPCDLDAEILAMEAGADAFLHTPVHPRALRARVQAGLRHKDMIDSLDETETVLFSLAESVEGRDPSLGQHCERLALMAAAMGMRIGLGSSDILALERGGYLHDLGKVAIPDNVLLKPGALTPEEWAIMKSHTLRGEKICKGVRSLAPVLPIIRHHHEKWDGSGYPDGLACDAIPLVARILQFADIYDALTAERPYKRAFTPQQALEIIRSEAAKGWRDPNLLPVFEDVLPAFASRSEQDSTSNSLVALARSIERYRRTPAAQPALAIAEPPPVKLVSGL